MKQMHIHFVSSVVPYVTNVRTDSPYSTTQHHIQHKKQNKLHALISSELRSIAK